MNLAKELSALHCGLYNSNEIDIEDKSNIINSLEDIEDFKYLHKFYKDYFSFMKECPHHEIDNQYARSRDLPFIGKSVIEKGQAKYIFYFEGSLSKTDKLSITVLAHLWLTNEAKKKKDFSEKIVGGKKQVIILLLILYKLQNILLNNHT